MLWWCVFKLGVSAGPPRGFNWNQGSGDAPIQDDNRLYDVNVQYIVDLFVNLCVNTGLLSHREVYCFAATFMSCGCRRSLADAANSATNNVIFLMG